jgi:hypothetical protein
VLIFAHPIIVHIIIILPAAVILRLPLIWYTVDQHMRHVGPCTLMHQLLREKAFTHVHVLKDVAVVRAAVVPALMDCV